MRRRKPPAAPPPSPGNHFAWQAHQAIQSWTASVDVKSSIVVVIETAVTGAAAKALITHTGELHVATGLQLATAICALTAVVLAVGAALWVVFPRLERTRTSAMASTGLVYFGHLRVRGPTEIAEALEMLTPEEERWQLAQQLHVTGQVAWRKHAWLQASLLLFALGSVLLVLAFVAF